MTVGHEDIARILSEEKRLQETSGRAEAAPVGGSLFNLMYTFADLFAADNPATCRLQHHIGPGILDFAVCHAHPGDTSATHKFEGGFNRERFLAACGLGAN